MESKKFGYVRVSSKDQNIDRQIDEMLTKGIDNRDIFVDKQSGKDFDRPNYKLLKSYLREGDTLYIKSLDRFGRNKEQIIKEWHGITKDIKADVIVTDMPLLDTTRYKNVSGLETLITDIVLQLLSFFAEEERQRIKIRQAEGIKAAKSRGKKFGRPIKEFPTEWDELYQQWDNEEISATDMFKKLNLPKSTFYKLVKKYKSINKAQRKETK